MRKFKFTWADVISVISAAGFGFVSFLSLNFLWKGAIQKSILFAISISVLLLLLIFIIKRIKSVRRNFQRNALFEIFAIAIYFLIAVAVSFVPYSHYFTVRDRKDDFKNKIVSDIDNTIKMFDEYEVHANKRIMLYEGLLNTAISGKEFNQSEFLSMGFQNNGEPSDIQKNRLMRIFKDDLMPAQYDTLKVHAIKSLEENKTIAMGWHPIGIIGVISSIAKDANDWLSILIGYDNSSSKAKLAPFEYQISFTSVERELTERSTPSLVAVISAIILHLLIFLPIFFTYRDPRHSGLFHELLNRGNDENEVGATL